MKKNEFDDIVKNDMMLNDRRTDDGGYGGFALSPNYIGENKVIELDDVVLNKITNKLNVDNLKYLKSGEYGDAYNIGNDKILKLTTDRSEALESQKIKGKFNKHLADIYNVYEVNYTIAGVNKKIYAILLEYLDVDKDKFTNYIKNINEYFREKTDTIILDIIDDYHFNRNVYNNEYKEHVEEFLELNNEESRFLEDFLNIIDELKKNNMNTADYVNMGNLGYKKNGKLGYFDFGYGDENGEIKNIININERKLSYMDGSQAVQVKDKCKLGGLGNTSAACNQGDISNITLTNLKEDSEYIDGYTGCLMLKLNIPKWNKIISGVNKKDIYIKPYDDSYGLEEDPHVTIKYGISDVIKPDEIFEFINKYIDGEVKLQLTGIGIFQNEDFDVVKFNVECEELRKLNELINNNFDHRDIYGDYKPHITIAYLKSGTGEKYVTEFDTPINISSSKLRYSNQNDGIDETYDVLNNLNDLQDSKNKPIFVEEDKILTEDTMTLNELPFIEDIKSIGGDLYAVGGIVRDELLGKESKDLDILITGVPMDKIEQIASKYGKVDAVGKQFGVLKFKPYGYEGEDIDIAIPRTEKSTGEGGHKGFDVVSDHNLSIEDDLLRRDFKINALAKDLNGKIIDPYGGLQDIKDKKISMVNPEAFSDDPLRMLRAVNFASRFGFDIDSDTMENIRKNAHKIKEIPPERILIEFDKIIKKGDIQKGVFLLKQTGLLKNIVGIDGGILVSNKWDDVTNMGEFIYLLTENLVDKPSEFYKNNLKGDIENINIIKALELAYNNYSDNKIENRVLIFNMNKISAKIMDSKILPDVLYNLISEFKQNRYPLTNKDLKVNGNDLMNLGFKGKEIGDMLRKILINIYADKLKNSKEDIINFVKTNKNE